MNNGLPANSSKSVAGKPYKYNHFINNQKQVIMKKSLLFAAALFASVAVNAQSVKWSCETASADGKNMTEADYTLDGVVSGSESIKAHAVTAGTGIIFPPTTCQKSHKDASGTSIQFGSEATPAIIKWVPTCASDAAIKTIDEAYAAGQYIDFKIEEGDIKKVLSLNNVQFNATRLGTDAVRINAKLIAAAEADYESDWLINGENWATVSDGTGAWVEATGAEGEIVGAEPSREDASKPASCDAGATTYTIPAPADFPEDAYEITLRIVVYGIGNNKAVAYQNVSINLGTEDGINDIKANTENVDAPAYNMAGQRVNNNFKGLMIKNGKKFINK